MIVTGAASKLAFSPAAGRGVTEGQSLATSPAVAVEDSAGNSSFPTPAASRSPSAPIGRERRLAQGTLSCSNAGFPTVAAVAGVVTFTNCQITGNGGAGTYTLQATRGGLTATGASSNVAINAGA